MKKKFLFSMLIFSCLHFQVIKPVSNTTFTVATISGLWVALKLGNYVFDATGLTPESSLKKELEALARTKKERELQQQETAANKKKNEFIALDAERKFKECMALNGNGSKKIPPCCHEAALFLAEFGGEKSDILLDF